MDDVSGEPLVHAPFYCHVRDNVSWRVPILYGHRPHTPDAHSTSRDRGLYGLWMLLLFYPWRNVERDLLGLCWQEYLTDSQPDIWQAIYLFFDNWLHTIKSISREVKSQYQDEGFLPQFTGSQHQRG